MIDKTSPFLSATLYKALVELSNLADGWCCITCSSNF